MPKHSDPGATFWLATPQFYPERLLQAASRRAAKIGPPQGLLLEAPRTASRRLSGQPARPARRSLPGSFQQQSRCADLVGFGSNCRP